MSWGWNKYREAIGRPAVQQPVPPPEAEPVPQQPAPPPPKPEAHRTDGTPPEPEDE